MDYGTRVGNETYTAVPATAHIRPLRDTLIVEPLNFEPSQTIAVVYRGKPLRGKIKAAGPGRYPLKYDGPKGKRTKVWDSKHFLPCDVKVGDIVELGGLELEGYLFQTVWWGGIEHIICRESDVAIIRDS